MTTQDFKPPFSLGKLFEHKYIGKTDTYLVPTQADSRHRKYTSNVSKLWWKYQTQVNYKK